MLSQLCHLGRMLLHPALGGIKSHCNGLGTLSAKLYLFKGILFIAITPRYATFISPSFATQASNLGISPSGTLRDVYHLTYCTRSQPVTILVPQRDHAVKYCRNCQIALGEACQARSELSLGQYFRFHKAIGVLVRRELLENYKPSRPYSRKERTCRCCLCHPP